jgi:ATP-dependent Clp protease ATP-binding subunit ClpC
MEALVKQKLQEIIDRLKATHSIELTIDGSVREFLALQGFHPTLGARPLKRLIQQEVLSALSYAIIVQGIPDHSLIHLSYLWQQQAWHIDWSLSP